MADFRDPLQSPSGRRRPRWLIPAIAAGILVVLVIGYVFWHKAAPAGEGNA